MILNYWDIWDNIETALGHLSERTATRDLSSLVDKNIFEQVGKTGKGTEYILSRHIAAKAATKTP